MSSNNISTNDYKKVIVFVQIDCLYLPYSIENDLEEWLKQFPYIKQDTTFQLYFELNESKEQVEVLLEPFMGLQVVTSDILQISIMDIVPNDVTTISVDISHLKHVLQNIVRLCEGEYLLDIKYEQVLNQPKDFRRKLLLFEQAFKQDISTLDSLLQYLGITIQRKHKHGCFYVINSLFDDEEEARLYLDNFVYYDSLTDKYYRFIYLLYAKFGNKLLDLLPDIDSIDTSSLFDIEIIEVDSIDDVRQQLLDGKILLIAQTGSGKTRTIKQLAKQGKKILLLVPLAVQVLQEEKSYLSNPMNYPKSAFFCQGSKCRDLSGTTFIVATYNQLENIRKRIDLSDWYVVIDEAHNLITSLTYRKSVLTHLWRLMNSRNQYLLMTATPHFLYLERFVDKVYKVRVKPKKNRYFTVISDSKYQTVLDNIRKLSKYPYKQFLYIDNKQTLYALKDILSFDYDGLVEVTTSEKRDSAYCIIDCKQTAYDVLLATRVLSEGFHIIQEGRFVYHVIPSDINVMVQKINRVREYNEKGEELDNWVFVILYVPNKVIGSVDYTKEWQKRFETYQCIISRLFDMGSNVDPVLLTPLVHASTYRDINEQLLVCSSKFVKSIVESEGFTYIGNTDVQTFDFYMYFELLSLLKQTNEQLYEVVSAIRQYPELFDCKTLQKYRQRIQEGKFSYVKGCVKRRVKRKLCH